LQLIAEWKITVATKWSLYPKYDNNFHHGTKREYWSHYVDLAIVPGL